MDKPKKLTKKQQLEASAQMFKQVMALLNVGTFPEGIEKELEECKKFITINYMIIKEPAKLKQLIHEQKVANG